MNKKRARVQFDTVFLLFYTISFQTEVYGRLNEENSSLSLESPVSDENVDLTLNGLAAFTGEEREMLDLTVTMSDITVDTQPTEGQTSVKPEFEQLGEQFAIEIIQNMEFELSMDYVDNEEAPAADTAA